MFCVEFGLVKVVYKINYNYDWEGCIYVHLFLWVDVCGYVLIFVVKVIL